VVESDAPHRVELRVCFMVNQQLVYVWYGVAGVVSLGLLVYASWYNPSGRVPLGKKDPALPTTLTMVPMQQQLQRLAAHQQLAFSNRLYQTARRVMVDISVVLVFYAVLLWCAT
jgi:hypothetical protein